MSGCLPARNLLPHPRRARRPHADQGTKQDLPDAVNAARARALARAPEALAVVRGHLADGGPFPERLHISTLFGRFYLDLFEIPAGPTSPVPRSRPGPPASA